MLRDALKKLIQSAVDALVASGKLSGFVHPPIEIIDPKNPEHGDYACNFALAAAKKAEIAPRQLAEMIRHETLELDLPSTIESIEIAGPGFLNFRLKPAAIASCVKSILEAGPALALRASRPNESRSSLNIEYVSVNPNGPITVGSARGAAFGDALAKVLAAAGHPVNREYYINDGVNSKQMRLFAESVLSYAKQTPVGDDGYKGDYVKAVADAIAADHSDEDVARRPVEWWQLRAQELMVERQRQDLATFGVKFDTWFSEQSMHDSGLISNCLDKLVANGAADTQCFRNEIVRDGKNERIERIPQECGPLWLRSTAFGDDKDRVLRRSDGRTTYVVGDVGYTESKLGQRGFDKAIIVLGPDHHGYISRMNAVCQALGYPLDRFEIVIFQIVRFVKNGVPAPMRKRDGNIYELTDLIREIGVNSAPSAAPDEQERIGRDVTRFFYLMRSHDTHMDFDIDLAIKQNDENPVFYVQYAHARICSVIEKAREAGIEGSGLASPYHMSLLRHPAESALIKKILDLPMEVDRCAQDYGVHRLTTYAVELARTYHHFYDACRVIQPSEPDLSRARLQLCEAARIGLRGVFDLLGVSAPERMDRELSIPS